MELCWRFGRFHFKKTCKTIRNFGVLWTQSKVQVVAVDWILSFRIKCVGLKVILGSYRWWAAGLFLTFWMVTRTVFRRTGRLQKKPFLIKIVGKNCKNMSLTVKLRHIQSIGTKKIRYCLF